MPRYIIERNFAEQLGLTKDAVESVNRVNEEEGVAWIFSFLSADKRKTYCLYEAPNPEGSAPRPAASTYQPTPSSRSGEKLARRCSVSSAKAALTPSPRRRRMTAFCAQRT
jgi:Protein of unknown function (DUF4242)